MRLYVLKITTTFTPFITHVSFCLFSKARSLKLWKTNAFWLATLTYKLNLNSEVINHSFWLVNALFKNRTVTIWLQLKNILSESPARNFIIVNHFFKDPLADCLLLINTRRRELSVSLIICSQWTHYGICRGRANAFKVCSLYLSLKIRKRLHPASIKALNLWGKAACWFAGNAFLSN